NMLTECFHLVRSIKRLQRTFELDHVDGTMRSVTVEVILEDNGVHARVNFSPVDLRATPTKRVEPIDSLDLLIIDIGSIPNDIDTFISGVKESVSKCSIKTFADGPRIIFMG